MHSPRWTTPLLMMALLAVPVVGANAQQPISTGGGAIVEVEVVEPKNGKPPRDVRCVEKVKVIKGTANIQVAGQRRELHENEEVCVTPDLTLLVTTTAQTEQGGGPPGGVTPPPCVTGCNAAIQIR